MGISNEVKMSIPDLAVFFLLWFLLLGFVIGVGQLYFNSQSKKRIAEAIERGSPFFLLYLPLYKNVPVEIFQILALCGLPVVIAFAVILVVAAIRISLPIELNMVLLILSLVLQISVLFWILKFRKKEPMKKEFKGYNQAVITVLLSGPPEVFYRILIGVFAVFHILTIVKILYAQ